MYKLVVLFIYVSNNNNSKQLLFILLYIVRCENRLHRQTANLILEFYWILIVVILQYPYSKI